MSLESYLDSKPLYYSEIDYERFPQAYESIKSHLPKPKIVHLIGTNAKGSTGRFLANALFLSGKKTGHYTSPHILKFNERIWIDGSDISDEALEAAHAKLEQILDRDISRGLSYFEYTTLIAMIAFSDCEYVVLEAGLGGEYDATAVFDKVLSIFTPIDFDHSAFLGDSIKSIATTKLNAMSKNALVGFQSHSEVVDIAKEIALSKGADVAFLDNGVSEDISILAHKIATKNSLPHYMRDNLTLAMSAFAMLNLEIDESYFSTTPIFGRLSKIADNITLDVGHNAQAARAIAKAFDGKKVVLIYNSYSDKDYKEILKTLSNIIKRVEIISVEDERITPRDEMVDAIVSLGLEYRDFSTIGDDEYLVFGSFSVAESFLKRYYDKLV